MKDYRNASMDDIIFEGRNKQYGAYELRQDMDRHTSIGLAITVSAFTVLLLMYGAGIFQTRHLTPPDIIVTLQPRNIVLPEEVVPPKPVARITPPPANTIKNTAFSIVPNTTPTPPPATQEDLNKYTASTVTSIDPSLSAVSAAPIENTGGTAPSGSVAATVEDPAATTNIIITYSEIMPSFKGGKVALMEYLKNNIRPFETDKESKLSGKIIVRFYIDTDGMVRNPVVIKDNVGGRCAEAAVEAIRKMPKWNPGMQGNKPVKVYFTLPVTFDFTDY